MNAITVIAIPIEHPGQVLGNLLRKISSSFSKRQWRQLLFYTVNPLQQAI